MSLPGIYPAEVVSYDQGRRTVTVSIPGVTDGAVALAEAQLVYPLGDKTDNTEIEILPGDRVWVMFINGDARHPVVMGYRPRHQENRADWRRWHHANLELEADAQFTVQAADIRMNANGTVTIKAGAAMTLEGATVLIKGPTTIDGTLSVTGPTSLQSGLAVSGTATANGKNIGSDHSHTNVQGGTGTSGPPA